VTPVEILGKKEKEYLKEKLMNSKQTVRRKILEIYIEA
jgi:hypothetical protein